MHDKNKTNIECEIELSESSFTPPQDDRMYRSGVSDIEGGDNFYDYAEWFWDMYENQIFDCNN